MGKLNLSGKWRNQHGSELDLKVGTDGRVHGSFRSAVGDVDQDREFEVVGVQSGDLVAFCADFHGQGVTAWAGQYTAHEFEEELLTQWHLALDVPEVEEPDWLWSGVRTGEDRFVRRREPEPDQSPPQ